MTSRAFSLDRYGAYNWLEVASRQVCWAHLKRDFIQIAERTSAELGTALLEQQKHLFALWYQVRDGTLSRPDLIAAVVRIRARVHELCMKQPVTRSLQEKTPWNSAITASSAQLEPTMWLFITVEGATNNGSVFVARMLTVVTTLHSQNRNVLEYLSQACQAAEKANLLHRCCLIRVDASKTVSV